MSGGVRYLAERDREPFRLFVRDGKLHSARDGGLFDTAGGYTVRSGGPGTAIFVMDVQGNLYASTRQSVGQFHHSSFLAGAPVAGAGELVITSGVLIEITDRSGHYRLTPDFLARVLAQLSSQGVDMTRVSVVTSVSTRR